jgi:serine/threonine protein kinase
VNPLHSTCSGALASSFSPPSSTSNKQASRIVKPDNIGIGRLAGSGAYRLMLFDFSLSRTPVENIHAGTKPYLDPFLVDRTPPRWDLQAERYAAAVTLHEMLTGIPPTFGDGLTDPAVTDDEANPAIERFDPALRDELAAFFARALRRDPAERFGNAEEMLRAWRQAFAPLERSAIAPDSIEMLARRLDRTSSIAEVGYGAEARAVLEERMNIYTVAQLLGVPRQQFRYLRPRRRQGAPRNPRASQTPGPAPSRPHSRRHRRGRSGPRQHRPVSRAANPAPPRRR